MNEIRSRNLHVFGRLFALTLCALTICVLTGCGAGRSNSFVAGPAFSPSSGPAGTLVTITGGDFSTTQSVSIGGVAALPISQSSSQLVALVMPGATTGQVSVTTSGGTLTGSGNFTVTATGVPANQQGTKLVGSGNTGAAQQGRAVTLSADGNTALVGGVTDNTGLGASWVYTRAGGAWTQQGTKLVGTGYVQPPGNGVLQGFSVALSADGNTALIGGPVDNSGIGAAWVFTRSNGAWTQQGGRLVGSGATGIAEQGLAVALSADGNTALIGGPNDNTQVGATWVFTRSNGTWTQQGSKLVGTGVSGAYAYQGGTVALSADGNTAMVGGQLDNYNSGYGVGAAWVFTRSNGSWTQQGAKLVGTGTTSPADQGSSVALSADGNTALVGGVFASGGGAAWAFTRSNGSWTQQGELQGTGVGGINSADQGWSVALSADGNTALVGGPNDNANNSLGVGAIWVFTRAGSTWTQAGSKLVGTGASGNARQGYSVALSLDGNTASLGGPNDNSNIGALWVFTP